jgi:hypothetical protein
VLGESGLLEGQTASLGEVTDISEEGSATESSAAIHAKARNYASEDRNPKLNRCENIRTTQLRHSKDKTT